jgi:phospholipid/cholesterol/gamma-HCH transport system permease protein
MHHRTREYRPFAAAIFGRNPLREDGLREDVQAAGKLLASFFEWFGEFGAFCARLFRAIFMAPFEGRELIRQMDAIGSKSLPLVALAGAATGVVLSLQTRDSLARFGGKTMLPAVNRFSLLK